MRKLLLAAMLWLWAAPAFALLCPSVPNVFVNGSVADANQMNANFTTLLNCFNSSVATNGANTNISSLLGLTAPPAGAGSLVFWGGTAGGTANAITLASTNPGGFAPRLGDTVMFLAAAPNTTATTINVVGTGVVALTKVNYSGVAALAGGEIAAAGQLVAATWDGTQFEMLNFALPQYATVHDPAVTVLTSGSGTYTPASWVHSLDVEMCGAGSGGGGSGSTSTGGAGGVGGDTTFGASLTAHGGAATPVSGVNTYPTAATAIGGDMNIPGPLGQAPNNSLTLFGGRYPSQPTGGMGASSRYGGGGSGGGATTTGSANDVIIVAAPGVSPGSGGGGGGALADNSVNTGWGGNAGACLSKTITAIAASYAYVVGAAGTAGTAGTNGYVGADGAGGVISITAR